MMRTSGGRLTLSYPGYSLRSVPGAIYPTAPDGRTITELSRDLTSQYQTALATLNSFVSLPENWDYENGHPLTPEGRSAGVIILNALATSGIVPHVSPLHDGGLLVEAETNYTDLTVDVEPSGTVRLYVSVSGGEYESIGPAAHVAAILSSQLSAIGASR
jgi:hypothetical protein